MSPKSRTKSFQVRAIKMNSERYLKQAADSVRVFTKTVDSTKLA